MLTTKYCQVTESPENNICPGAVSESKPLVDFSILTVRESSLVIVPSPVLSVKVTPNPPSTILLKIT